MNPTPRKSPLPTTGWFLTVKDVADRWGISERQVRRNIASGELKSPRFGRSVRLAPDDVQLFELRCRGVAM